jgi:hypothetical protein
MATGAVAVSSGGGGGGGGIRWNQRAARQSGFYLGLSLGRCRGALHGHPFEALHRVCDLLDLFRDLELHLQLLDLLLQRLDLRFLGGQTTHAKKLGVEGAAKVLPLGAARRAGRSPPWWSSSGAEVRAPRRSATVRAGAAAVALPDAAAGP